MIATFSVFTVGFIYCKLNTASVNSYYSYVAKVYLDNKKVLQDYAYEGNYSYFPDVEGIRDMSHSDDWFQLELDRRFNGKDLIYYGLFYLRDMSRVPRSAIPYEEITDGNGSYSYSAEDGMRYELKKIADGFFYYVVKY